MQSYATERLNRGGDRMEPVGIRMTGGIQLAAGAGELRLTSTDPTVQPFLDYRYLEDPFDRERLREAVRLCVRLGEDERFRDIIAERLEPSDADLSSEEALDAWLMLEVTTSQHISCTCKMGPSRTLWRWLISTAGSTAWKGCGWRTPRSCPTASGPTPT